MRIIKENKNVLPMAHVRYIVQRNRGLIGKEYILLANCHAVKQFLCLIHAMHYDEAAQHRSGRKKCKLLS